MFLLTTEVMNKNLCVPVIYSYFLYMDSCCTQEVRLRVVCSQVKQGLMPVFGACKGILQDERGLDNDLKPRPGIV